MNTDEGIDEPEVPDTLKPEGVQPLTPGRVLKPGKYDAKELFAKLRRIEAAERQAKRWKPPSRRARGKVRRRLKRKFGLTRREVGAIGAGHLEAPEGYLLELSREIQALRR